MKAVLLILSISLVASLGNSQLLAYDIIHEVPDNIYLVQGFDTNDNVEIIFEGQYPNACYKVGPTKNKVDSANKKIYLDNLAYRTQDEICARVIVPYQKEVHLGPLEGGKYEVLFKNAEGNYDSQGFLTVEKATAESVDNYLYAPVNQIVSLAGTKNIRLEGEITRDCLELDRVEVSYTQQPAVVVVLPIMKMVKESKCSATEDVDEFSYEVDLSEVPEGRYLIHTRTLNGRARNKIMNL